MQPQKEDPPAKGTADLTAQAIVDSNLYLVLATADPSGLPWSSPVYFAHESYAEFFWVSSPTATHSRNIAARPQVGIVIFDSHAPIGTGQGVYISAVAEQAGGEDLARGMKTFSRRSLAHGGTEWTVEDVQGDSALRLYHAVADSRSILAKDGRPTTASPPDRASYDLRARQRGPPDMQGIARTGANSPPLLRAGA